MQFSPQGDRIVTSGSDGTTRIWDLNGNQIAQYEGWGFVNADWSLIALIQDPNPLLPNQSPGQVVTLWPVDDLDGLIARACEKLQWYLRQSPNVTDSDRALCGIVTKSPAD